MLGLILEVILDVIRKPAKRAMNHFDEQSHFDEQRLGLQRYATFLFINLLVLLSLGIGRSYPLTREWLSLGMIVLGIPMFGVAMMMYGRYSKVYDHEPTWLFGASDQWQKRALSTL